MCFGILCSLLPFRRGKKKNGKNDNYLTPFEKEMVPVLLKDVYSHNDRFYEVVCFRWFKESANIAPLIEDKKPSYEKEGLALKSLVNKMAKCLLEKGILDEDCEVRLAAFRQRRVQYHDFKASAHHRKKSYVIDFSIERNSADRQSTMKAFRRDASSLRVPDPSAPRRRFSSKSSQASAAADSVFLLMGDILVRQFQCTINMDETNVHERELKVIVWRHFVQTLVAFLMDKERFP